MSGYQASYFGAIMTSISATPSSYQSPLQLLQAELQSEVNSGAVSSSDQGALSSALTDINSSLQGGSPASGTPSTTNSSPGDLKSKIDNLIAGEVSSGKLTSQQATELQGVFQNAFANGPGGPERSAIRRASRRCARWRPPQPSRRPWRRGGFGVISQFVLDRQHQFVGHQFVGHQFGRQHPAAVSAGLAGFAVELVNDLVRCDRQQLRRELQFVVLGAADQLPDLIPLQPDHHAPPRRNYLSQNRKDDGLRFCAPGFALPSI
jgi:hypothetical protein